MAKRTSCSLPAPGGQASLQATRQANMSNQHDWVSNPINAGEENVTERNQRQNDFKFKQVTHKEKCLWSLLTVSAVIRLGQTQQVSNLKNEATMKALLILTVTTLICYLCSLCRNSLELSPKNTKYWLEFSKVSFKKYEPPMQQYNYIYTWPLHGMSVSCESGLVKHSHDRGGRSVRTSC